MRLTGFEMKAMGCDEITTKDGKICGLLDFSKFDVMNFDVEMQYSVVTTIINRLADLQEASSMSEMKRIGVILANLMSMRTIIDYDFLKRIVPENDLIELRRCQTNIHIWADGITKIKVNVAFDTKEVPNHD